MENVAISAFAKKTKAARSLASASAAAHVNAASRANAVSSGFLNSVNCWYLTKIFA